MKKLSTLFTLLVAIFISSNLLAKDIYVSGVNGNDSNTGTLDKPYKTVGKASGAAAAGDVIHLRAGTYPKSWINAQGNATSKIIFQSYAGEKAIFDGGYTGSNGVGPGNDLVTIGGKY